MEGDPSELRRPADIRALLGDVMQGSQQASPAPNNRRTWPWIVAVVAGLLLVVYIVLGAANDAAGPNALRSQANAQAAETDTGARLANDIIFDATGYVVAARRATVSADTTGRLAKVFVSEGSRVKRGDTLARLDTRDLMQQVALAESELAAVRNMQQQRKIDIDAANDRYQRVKELNDRGFATEASYKAALFELQGATASRRQTASQIAIAERELAIRRQYLRNADILAPFDGLVIETAAQPGEIVSPISAGGGFTRTGICTLVDMNSLEVRVQVNEKYISRIHPGQKVRMVPRAYPNLRLVGKVVRTLPAASRETGAVEVVLTFDSRDERVLPNMSIDVAFIDDGARS